MPRNYSATFDGVTVSALQDLFEVNAGTDKPVNITGLLLSQSSDAGDTEDEQLRITITRGHATSGSGGTSVTAQPLDSDDTAFGGTVEANNTTQASTGSPVVMVADSFNVRAGYVWQPTPEQYVRLNGGERAVVELPAAPADALTMSGTIFLQEV